MTTRDIQDEVRGWVAGRIPDGWFTGAPDVTVDREELLIVGTLADVELEGEATPAATSAARSARASRFREETRAQRMRIADEAEHRFGRKVSWGVRIGDQT